MSLKPKEIHQAVVLIDCNDDDDNNDFHSLQTSKVLIKLFERPLLQYTIDMLIMSNIDEIFLFCSNYYDEIKNFISEYMKKFFNKINIEIFYSEDYTNLGSVMRDLDSRCIIKSNFILIHGDCIGNIQLNKLIDKHKENIQKDPGCVMTCIFRKTCPNHRSRNKQKIMIVLDSQNKIVLFEKSMEKCIELPKNLFDRNSTLSIHYDLYDTQIAICSEKVPPDFSDNFDFETRENFIHGLLADIELLCHHIHIEILDEGYAARVDSIKSYDNISKDLVQRFVYPIVADGFSNDSLELYDKLKININDIINDDDNDNDYDSDSTKFSISSNESLDSIGDEYSAFYNEVYDSLSRGIDENSLAENIILEINSSKHAYNVPMNEVNSLVIKALLNLALINNDNNLSKKIKSNLCYGLPIIQNYIKNLSSQNDCIYALEEFQLQNKDKITNLLLTKIIDFFYKENVLEEEIILKWFYKPKNNPSEQETLRKSKELIKYIEWLEEAEEESSEDE